MTAGMCFEAGAAVTVTLAGGTTVDVGDATVWVVPAGGPAPGWRGVAHLLTADEAGAALCCGVWKVGQLVRDGHLPYVQVGNVRRFHPDDINAYIDRNRHTAHREDQLAS